MHSLTHWTIVGFSGHRSLDNKAVMSEAIAACLDELSTVRLAAVSSAASGADTCFLEVVQQRRIPYSLILPFDSERFRRDFSPAGWEQASAFFPGALEIDVVDPVDSDDEAYLDGGLRTVDQCDVLIAVWNGKPAAGKGGTGDVVAYAREVGKPLVWIHSETGQRQNERLTQLTRPNVRREDNSTAPALEQVKQQLAEFDAVAKQHAPRTRQLTIRIIQLHLAATALGISGYVLGLHGAIEHVLTLFELVALSIALFLAFRIRHSHHLWLGARTAAELCRLFKAVWPMRRQGAHIPPPSVAGHDDLVRDLRLAWLVDKEAALPLKKARDHYLVHRVHDQAEYFRDKYKSAGDRGARLRQVALVATLTAMACGVMALGVSLGGHHGWWFKLPRLAAMVLPLLPPALLSLVIALDMNRRSERYSDVTAALERIEKRLRRVQTWPGLWREVQRCESLLLQEHAEWHALARYGSEH